MKVYTRNDYMDRKISHDDYYRQFVNTSVINTVKRGIGIQRIANSTDEHMNDIPLELWDALPIRHCIDISLWRSAHPSFMADGKKLRYTWSLNDNICIAKAAARMIKEGLK